MNPKDTAAQLAEQIDRCLETLTMAAKRRVELEELRVTAESMAEKLAYFDENFLPLDIADGSDAFAQASEKWDALPAGVLTSGNERLEQLVAISKPLRRLHQAGMSILSIKKFAPEELRFAELLGDSFAELSEPWGDLKRTIHRPPVVARFRRADLAVARRFFSALEQLGIVEIEGYEHPFYEGKEITWVPADPSKLPRTLGDRAPLRCRMKIKARDRQPFLTGEWLNAYASRIVGDHLSRNSVAHEIYTNVVYKAPADIINVSGDFDVMVQAGDHVAVFECKSGALDPARGDLEQTLEKAAGLRRVFERTGADVDLTTLLLFNPKAADPARIAEALAGTGIVPVTPEQVRGEIRSLFHFD